MTEMTLFDNTIQNINISKDYSYMLNFWHTTKLNKKYEYIKRNGIHPSTITLQKNGINEIDVREGNSIQTYFYTVYKIFLEHTFNSEVKIAKLRDQEEWAMSFKNDIEGLSSPVWLLMNYAYCNVLASDIIEFNNRARTSEGFKIKLREKDQLHSKKLMESLEIFESHAKKNLDNNIRNDLNSIVDKLESFLDLPLIESKKKRATKKPSIIIYEAEVAPEVGRLQAGVQELLPIYRQLNPSIIGMETRVRFAFILNYAQQGTNLAVNRIENSEPNYREFMRITNNMTL